MYRKIATAVVTALVLATSASAAVSKTLPGFSAAEKAMFDRTSNPNTNGF